MEHLSHPEGEKTATENINTPKVPATPVDYDNADKTDARHFYKDFFAAHFTRKELSDMDVLCLSAEEWLDVRDVFDPLKISRKKVWGAEFDTALQPRAKQKADELGTNFHPGDVRELLQKKQFGLIILDLKSQFSDIVRRLLADIWLPDKAGIVVNMQRCREPGGVQELLRDTQSHIARAVQSKTEPIGKHLLSTDLIKEAQAVYNPEATAKELMNDVSFWDVFATIGMARTDKWNASGAAKTLIETWQRMGGTRGYPGEELRWAMAMANDWFVAQFDSLLQRTTSDPDDLTIITHNIAPFVQRMTQGRSLLTTHTTHQYHSPEHRTPFMAHIGVMERPRKDMQTMNRLMEFFLTTTNDLFTHSTEEHWPDAELYIRDYKNSEKRLQWGVDDIEPRSSLVYRRDGKDLHSLHMQYVDSVGSMMKSHRDRCALIDSFFLQLDTGEEH